MKYENKELQNRILLIFKEFKKICDKYDLKYYAIGGTCIGAVRHQGFIPWDDDIDVAMPIEDMLKLRSIAEKELNSNLKLVDYLDSKRNYRTNFFLKIEDIRTTFVEELDVDNPKKYKGVFLDIMPLCGCPKDEKDKEKLILKFYKNVKLNFSKNKKIQEIQSFKGKILWLLLKPIVFLHNDTYYLKKNEKLAENNKIEDDKNILFAWRIPKRGNYKNCFPYDFFGTGIELKFEDTTMRCPSKFEEYLTEDFGDYMKLPPISKRVTHMPKIYDLNKSYIEYQKEYKR